MADGAFDLAIVDLMIPAIRHGSDLLKRGSTVAQVVHDYGGVCQAVTELAAETNAPISADESRIFNRCLDDAIAEAVTEYTRQREQLITDEGRERSGEFAHELRNTIGAATCRSRSCAWARSGSKEPPPVY